MHDTCSVPELLVIFFLSIIYTYSFLPINKLHPPQGQQTSSQSSPGHCLLLPNLSPHCTNHDAAVSSRIPGTDRNEQQALLPAIPSDRALVLPSVARAIHGSKANAHITYQPYVKTIPDIRREGISHTSHKRHKLANHARKKRKDTRVLKY